MTTNSVDSSVDDSSLGEFFSFYLHFLSLSLVLIYQEMTRRISHSDSERPAPPTKYYEESSSPKTGMNQKRVNRDEDWDDSEVEVIISPHRPGEVKEGSVDEPVDFVEVVSCTSPYLFTSQFPKDEMKKYGDKLKHTGFEPSS